MRRSTIALLLLLGSDQVSAQLRPRRVGGAGFNAMGQQEEVPAAATGTDGFEGMADLERMAEQLGANGGMPDMAKIMEMMAGGDLSNLMNNPMLKGLASANPELAEMLSNPELMKEKIAEVSQMLNSEEGMNMASKMMEEMQSVMTDPDKLQQALQQIVDNPALKGFANAVPGLAEALADPDALRNHVEKAAEIFQKMQDPEQMQERTRSALPLLPPPLPPLPLSLLPLLRRRCRRCRCLTERMPFASRVCAVLQGMGGMEGMAEQMKKMMSQLGAEGGSENDALANMLRGLGGLNNEDSMGGEAEGGGAEGLKERVARLLAEARLNDQGLDEF